jgi:transcriptional regulator with XRE-family HTH domain
MSVAKAFGENLRRARKRLSISQEEAAIRASLHRTEIGLLERGERVARIDTAIRLAGGVGVPLCELLDGIEWKPGTMQAGTFSVSAEQSSARRKG